MTKQAEARRRTLEEQQGRLLTVKEYAFVTRENPMSVYRRIREKRQVGVCRVGGNIRLKPPQNDDE